MSLTPYKDAVLAQSGLVGLWELGEPSGTFADVKNGNTGSIVEVSFSDELRAEASLLPNGEGKSLKTVRHANTTGQYVNVPFNATLQVGDIFTLEMWVKLATLANNESLFSKDTTGGANSGPELRVGSAGTILLLKNNVAGIVSSTSNLSASTVYHVACTKSGATVKLYLNAVDVTGVVSNATMNDEAAMGWALGARLSDLATDDMLNGWMQYGAIYNVALAGSDILSHYNKGSEALVADSGPAPRGVGQLVPSGFERSRGGTGLLIPRTRN